MRSASRRRPARWMAERALLFRPCRSRPSYPRVVPKGAPGPGWPPRAGRPASDRSALSRCGLLGSMIAPAPSSDPDGCRNARFVSTRQGRRRCLTIAQGRRESTSPRPGDPPKRRQRQGGVATDRHRPQGRPAMAVRQRRSVSASTNTHASANTPSRAETRWAAASPAPRSRHLLPPYALRQADDTLNADAKQVQNRGMLHGDALPGIEPAPQARRFADAFAALDLGTNNCRLLVGVPTG